MSLCYYKKTKTKTKKFNLSQWHFRLVIFSLTIILLLTYLISINNTATKGIEISQMENKLKRLTDKNRSLEVKVDELKSLNRIEKISTDDLSMVATEKYYYWLPEVSGGIAVKK